MTPLEPEANPNIWVGPLRWGRPDDPDDEDAEVDYEITWIENDDGSIAAEIRPS